MEVLLTQLVGLTLYLATVVIGYRLGLAKLGRTSSAEAKIGLLFVVATGAGGFWGAPVWWAGVEGAFAWTLVPLAGRLLAAAGMAFAGLSVLTIRNPSRSALKMFAILVATYLWPLVVAIAVAHRNMFDWRAAVTYAFFAIVALLSLTSLWFVLRNQWRDDDEATRWRAMDVWTRVLFAGIALLAGAWGLTQFFGVRVNLPGTGAITYNLLTGRLIAVMLVTVSVGSVFALIAPSVQRMQLIFLLVYAIGACLASAWPLLEGRALATSYFWFWGAIGVMSTFQLVRMWGRTLPTQSQGLDH